MKTLLHAFAVLSFAGLVAACLNVYWLPVSALATNDTWNSILWLELYLSAYLLSTWLLRRFARVSGRVDPQ
jgi:hypothetical protein